MYVSWGNMGFFVLRLNKRVESYIYGDELSMVEFFDVKVEIFFLVLRFWGVFFIIGRNNGKDFGNFDWIICKFVSYLLNCLKMFYMEI